MKVKYEGITFNVFECKVSNLMAGNGAKTTGVKFLLCSETGKTEISETVTKSGIRRAGGVKQVVRSMIEYHYRYRFVGKNPEIASDLAFSYTKRERTRQNQFEREFRRAYAAREKLIGYGLVSVKDVEIYGANLEQERFDDCEKLILSKSSVLSSGSNIRRSFMCTIEANYRKYGDGCAFEYYDWELSVFFKYCSHMMKLYSKVFGACHSLSV